MKCPNCDETLIMSNRQNVEIDYCPKCRGVWLDRGELDKIIERSAREESQSHEPPKDGYGNNERYREEEKYRGDDYYRSQKHPQKKKKGFLGDFFDFD